MSDPSDKSDVTGARRWVYAAVHGYNGSRFVVREETPNTAFDEWPLVAKIESEADARAVCVGHDVALGKTFALPSGARVAYLEGGGGGGAAGCSSGGASCGSTS